MHEPHEIMMSDFKRLDFTQVSGGSTAACERLPDVPALYAFFAPTPTLPSGDKDAFMNALKVLVEQRASPTLNAKAGSLHSVTLENFSQLSFHKQSMLEEIANDEEFRKEIAAIVNRCMPLRSPLYVGQTATLRTRVTQHLRSSSPLAIRLRLGDIRIEQCVLCYRLMSDMNATFHDTAVLQLTEEMANVSISMQVLCFQRPR